MSKRIFTFVILLAICASFVGCAEGAPNVKAPEEQLVDIQDYLGKNTVYFMPDLDFAKQAISQEGLNGDAAFNAFVATWGEYAPLPEALVKSYTDKLMASNEGMKEEEAQELAKTLIKEEMVVAMAFRTLCDDKAITDEVRKAAAVDFGIAHDSSEGGAEVNTDNYGLDAFIKHQTVAAYLADEELPYGIELTTEETSFEESSK